jgi:hypothetical protein
MVAWFHVFEKSIKAAGIRSTLWWMGSIRRNQGGSRIRESPEGHTPQ